MKKEDLETVELENEDDIIAVINAAGDYWTRVIQPLRCPTHERGIGLHIEGTKADDDPESRKMYVTVTLDICCKEYMEDVLQRVRLQS